MERNDIIKALECHSRATKTVQEGLLICENECPFICEDDCTEVLARNALTLIKQLTEENKRLKEKADRHLDNLKAVLDERAEEKSKVERYMLKSDGSLEMIPTVESVRQDVAREILEEIEKSIMSPDQSQNYKEWYFAELKKKYIGE